MNSLTHCFRCLNASSFARLSSIKQVHNGRGFRLLADQYSLQRVVFRDKISSYSCYRVKQCNVLKPSKTQCRILHTSSPRPVGHVLLQWLLLKPIAKVSAVLLGRAFRKSWKDLPKNKRGVFLEEIKRYRWHIAAVVVLGYGLSLSFYYSHLQEAPYSGRKRFLVFNDSQMASIVQNEYEGFLKEFDGKFLPESHPLFQVTARIAKQIVNGNLDFSQIAKREWTVHVIHRDMTNAFVLPNGHIFVFTGLFKTCNNEEQLGIVLAHEMAHVVMNHSAELVSFSEFVEFLLIGFLAAIWAFLPNDGVALVATWFKNKIVQILLQMPYSRVLETEADDLGLVLAAKACFDVRESQAFWTNMAHSKEGEDIEIEWLSTHPSNQNRADHLAERIPQAIELRKICNCPPLPVRDPMVELVKKRQQVVAVPA